MASLPDVPEISPEELARCIEHGDGVQVLDVRAPARVAAGGRIDLIPDQRFHNIVGSRLASMGSTDEVGLDPGVPVTVVCGHGNSSRPATQHLNDLGYEARSLRGGMAAWMVLTVPRELVPPESLDALVQFDRVGKGALAYLLVSEGNAFIIDPPRRPDAVLEAARTRGATVIGVADTHVHADYISGAPALARDLEVPYYLHPADAVYPYDGTPGRLDFEPLADGAELSVGRSTIRVMHTPGHTEGSVTYLVDDAAAFTGDFIFVESIGRPDLAGKTDEWKHALWQSLERAKREWPADLEIYPAHYATDAERRPDRSVGARFGELLEGNDALGMTAEAFGAWIDSRAGAFPEQYRQIKAVNVGLMAVTEPQAEELEVGRNECAVA